MPLIESIAPNIPHLNDERVGGVSPNFPIIGKSFGKYCAGHFNIQ